MKTTFALAALAVSAVSGHVLQPRWPHEKNGTTSTVTDYTTTYVTECPVTTTK